MTTPPARQAVGFTLTNSLRPPPTHQGFVSLGGKNVCMTFLRLLTRWIFRLRNCSYIFFSLVDGDYLPSQGSVCAARCVQRNLRPSGGDQTACPAQPGPRRSSSPCQCAKPHHRGVGVW